MSEVIKITKKIKYKIGQEVYIADLVLNEVSSGKIIDYHYSPSISLNTIENDNIKYSISGVYYVVPEEFIFKTQKELKNFLKNKGLSYE
jgi:ribosome biogenesis GTPase A